MFPPGHRNLAATIVLAAVCTGHTTAQPAPADSQPKTPPNTAEQQTPPKAWPTILLVDETTIPQITLRWSTRDAAGAAKTNTITQPRPYGTDPDRTPMSANTECYAGIGGTRLKKSAGHPRGAIVRAGFYKVDNDLPFFDDILPGSDITVEITGVRFTQPVHANAEATLQHLKYDPSDLESCGLPGDAKEQFNLASNTDTLNDRSRPGIDARQGALSGDADSLGSVKVEQIDPFTVTLRATFSYAALRNLRDPWQSDLPGTFLEPFHFHIEFEILPASVEIPTAAAKPATDSVP